MSEYPASDAADSPGELRRATSSGDGGSEDRGQRLVAGRQLGAYRLEKELGRGAMGVVWRASVAGRKAPVALKFLPPVIAASAEELDALRAALAEVAQLEHPRLAAALALELADGFAFFATECVDGPSLYSVLNRRRAHGERGLAAGEALWVLSCLAPALDHAHAAGCVHGDLRPANLMLRGKPLGPLGPAGPALVITDFYLARAASDALRHLTSCTRAGALPYTAPELLEGGAPDTAADVYGLGATLFQLVAGRPPFDRGDVAAQIKRWAPPALHSGDERLDAAVGRALSKDPSQRPASVGALAALAGAERARDAAALDGPLGFEPQSAPLLLETLTVLLLWALVAGLVWALIWGPLSGTG